VADILDAGGAGGATTTIDSGLNDNVLARLEGGYTETDFTYDTGKLVAESYGDGVVCYGVGFRGCEGWATEVFVQVCTTDSDVSRGDLVVSVMFLQELARWSVANEMDRVFRRLDRNELHTLTWPSPHI